MAVIYYNLVKAGRREIGKVPQEFREEVQKMLDADKKDK